MTSKTTPKTITAGGDEVSKAGAHGRQGCKGGKSGASKDLSSGASKGGNSGSAKTTAQNKTGYSTRWAGRTSSEKIVYGIAGGVVVVKLERRLKVKVAR